MQIKVGYSASAAIADALVEVEVVAVAAARQMIMFWGYQQELFGSNTNKSNLHS
jgi:hypothetical protein